MVCVCESHTSVYKVDRYTDHQVYRTEALQCDIIIRGRGRCHHDSPSHSVTMWRGGLRWFPWFRRLENGGDSAQVRGGVVLMGNKAPQMKAIIFWKALRLGMCQSLQEVN